MLLAPWSSGKKQVFQIKFNALQMYELLTVF